MFSAEHLLRGLVTSALSSGLRGSSGLGRRRSRGYQTSISAQQITKLGMGALGLAIAAYEHLSAKKDIPQSGSSPSNVRPPAPPSSIQTPPPPPTLNPKEEEDSTLLLKVMVAAALSDGVLDESERAKIYSKLADEGISSEEQEFLDNLISNPSSVTELASGITDKSLAEQMYAAALVAISVDSAAEQRFINSLASALGLSQDQQSRWKNIFGIS